MKLSSYPHLALSATGGVLYALGHVGFGAWPLLWFSLAPLWRGQDPRWGHSLSYSAGCGFIFGACAYVLGYSWLWSLVEVFLEGNRWLAVGLWIANGAWFAIGFAIHTWLLAILGRRGWSLTGSAVASLIVVQWLQPQLFAAELGTGLIHAPLLAQTAEWGGPLLLTAWVAAINGVLVSIWSWKRQERGRPDRGILAVLTMSTIALLFGGFRMGSWTPPSSSTPIRVGIVQANLSPSADAAERIRAHRRYLELSRTLTAQTKLDLIVWPESAYGPAVRLPLPVAGQTIRGDLTTPLLFGGTSLVHDEHGEHRGNSVFLVETDGMIRSMYRKNLLIPFAEFLPFEDVVPSLREWFPHAQRFSPPDRSEALKLNHWRIVTPICYEVVHASYVRHLIRRDRPHLLVTLANDAWFGDSQEPWIHLNLTRLRAIENRRWVVRATNSGISAVIDPLGRVVTRSELFAPDTLQAIVYPRSQLTIYARLGDWPGWLAGIAIVLGLMLRRQTHKSTEQR